MPGECLRRREATASIGRTDLIQRLKPRRHDTGAGRLQHRERAGKGGGHRFIHPFQHHIARYRQTQPLQ